MPETAALVATLSRIEGKVDQLIEDVNAPPRHGHPGGLLVRQTLTEESLERVILALDNLKARIEALEATPGKTAITWADRLGLGLLGLLLSAIGAAVGAAIKTGGH